MAFRISGAIAYVGSQDSMLARTRLLSVVAGRQWVSENGKSTRLRCVWCESDYDSNSSPARQAALFCSRRCETEARFWLFSVLNSAPERE